MRRQVLGAATLIMALVLITLTTLIIVFAGKYGTLFSKSVANQTRNSQAFNAAQAGLQFGIAYLSTNSATITGSPVSGYINYGSSNASLTNVSLANGSRFSVVYTNPTANNFMLLRITSTGTSDDGTSTRTVSQLAYAGVSSLNDAITTRGNVVTSGNVNVSGGGGIHAGGNVTQSGTNNISSITANDSALSSLSGAALFSNIFGVSKATMQSQSTVFASTSGLNWSGLTGKNWINTTVVSSGNITVGSPSNPVLLVINGSLISSGSVTVYGVVYVAGSVTMSGNNNFNGGLIAEGAITMSGTVGAYNSSMISPYTLRTYAKVPGSWKDF